MIITLYGPDDYRRDAKKREIIDEFRHKHSNLGVGRFDVSSEEGRRDFEEFLGNRSIFESAKLAVLEGAPSVGDAAFREMLREILRREDATLIVTAAGKPPKAMEFLVKKPALVQEFPYLAGARWKKFAADEAKRQGVKLAPAALEFLTTLYARDTWRLATELEKLAAWGRTVTRGDLEALNLELTPDFWGLVQGFFRPRREERLVALERMFALREPAAKIFNIAAYQRPEALRTFAEYDAAVKTGRLDYEEALVALAIR